MPPRTVLQSEATASFVLVQSMEDENLQPHERILAGSHQLHRESADNYMYGLIVDQEVFVFDLVTPRVYYRYRCTLSLGMLE